MQAHLGVKTVLGACDGGVALPPRVVGEEERGTGLWAMGSSDARGRLCARVGLAACKDVGLKDVIECDACDPLVRNRCDGTLACARTRMLPAGVQGPFRSPAGEGRAGGRGGFRHIVPSLVLTRARAVVVRAWAVPQAACRRLGPELVLRALPREDLGPGACRPFLSLVWMVIST